MKINDIPDNSIVRSTCNNQLYRLSYWETEEFFLMLRYHLIPIDKNFKEEIHKHEPSGLRCECADHLEIIAVPNNGLSDLKKLNKKMAKFSKKMVVDGIVFDKFVEGLSDLKKLNTLMSTLSKKEIVDAITFDEFIEYGKAANGGNIVNGMPWSFVYKDRPVTHSSDTHYLICLSEKRKGFIPDFIDTSSGTLSFTPDDMLITGEHGEVYPLPIALFRTLYEELDKEEPYPFMCKEQLAAIMNGREYSNELTLDEQVIARDNGLLVCFTEGHVSLMFDFLTDMKLHRKVEGFMSWSKNDKNQFIGKVNTNLPHATFDVMKNGQVFRTGIIIEKSEIEAHS